MPGTTVELLGLVNRLLPGPNRASKGLLPGYAARDRLDSRLIEAATTLGRRAAERFNETTPTAQERDSASTSGPSGPR
jgi:hypothetical protein